MPKPTNARSLPLPAAVRPGEAPFERATALRVGLARIGVAPHDMSYNLRIALSDLERELADLPVRIAMLCSPRLLDAAAVARRGWTDEEQGRAVMRLDAALTPSGHFTLSWKPSEPLAPRAEGEVGHESAGYGSDFRRFDTSSTGVGGGAPT